MIPLLATISRAISGVITPTDPYWDNVSLLLPFDSDYQDVSGNNLTVTAYGGADISTVDAKVGASSMLFDGVDDYLKVAYDPAIDLLAANDFTIEFWVKCLEYKASGGRMVTLSGGTVGWDNTGGIHLLIQASSTYAAGIQVYDGTGVAFINTGAIPLSTTTWNHVACVSQNKRLSLYYNGSYVGEVGADFVRPSGNPAFCVGTLAGEDGAPNTAFNGYIDDLRITKGIARYTSNFTPPAVAFPTQGPPPLSFDPYWGDVSLLLPFDSDYQDVSDNAYTVTANGGADISATESKWDGSSLYLDGTGDYLVVNGAILPATGDFTLECWVRLDELPATNDQMMIAAQYSDGAEGRLNLQIRDSGAVQLFIGGTGGVSFNSTATLSTLTWTHIALTRESYLFRIFVNGVLSATSPANTKAIYQGDLDIGFLDAAGGIRFLKGYIDDFRSTSVARYTANFTPPTAAFPTQGPTPVDPYWTNVAALLPMDSDFTDAAAFGATVTAYGSPAISTSDPKFTGNGVFDGTDDVLQIAGVNLVGHTSATTKGTNDFTIETWFKIGVADEKLVIGWGATGSGSGSVDNYAQGLRIEQYGDPSVFRVTAGNFGRDGSGGWYRRETVNLGLSNGWHFLALVVSNNTPLLFIDGINRALSETPSLSTLTDFSTVSLYVPKPIIVQAQNVTDGALDTELAGQLAYYVAEIDDIRITKGVARYTENFTPPTAAFPTQGPPLWTPAEITAALWLDAADASTITESIGEVSEWADKSGNNRHAVATGENGETLPTITSGYFNGLNAVSFDGVSDLLEAPNTINIQSHHVFIVGQHRSGLYGFSHNRSAVGATDRYYVTLNTTIGETLVGGIPEGSDVQVSLELNGNTKTLKVDGEIVGSVSDSNVYEHSETYIGGGRNQLPVYGDVVIGEFIVFSAPVSEVITQKLEGYLAHKWGLEGSLDAGHPYKSAPPTV